MAFKDSAGIAKITQAQDFDPFGLENWTSKYVNTAKDNRFRMNGNELEKETGFTDLGMRMYNPTIGRLLSIDRVAPIYSSYSTYGFCLNNPIKNVDIDGNFVIDAETARKYPALAFMVNHVLPSLANNPEVLQALAQITIGSATTINWGNGNKQDIIEYIKSQLVSGSGPNIIVTHPANNKVYQGSATNEGDGGHYAGNRDNSERNNLYLNRLAVESLENAAKVFIGSNGNNGGGNLAAQMFSIGHTVTHEFAHFLLNSIMGQNEENSRGWGYEVGDEFSKRAFKGNTFNPRADTQEKPGVSQFYNSNRNGSVMRGLTIGNQGLLDFISNFSQGSTSSGTKTQKKKKGNGGSALGGAHE